MRFKLIGGALDGYEVDVPGTVREGDGVGLLGGPAGQRRVQFIYTRRGDALYAEDPALH